MITVISKHLEFIWAHGSISDEDYLGAIHYIEQIRYRGNQFTSLCTSNIAPPPDFSPGIDVTGQELNHLYSRMAMWFELEAFVKDGKSFLDHLWRIIAHNHPQLINDNEFKNQKYMIQAYHKLKPNHHDFKDTPVYKKVGAFIESWGKYLCDFRNYIEYTEPLGGMLNSAAGKIEIKMEDSVTTNNIYLPDRFPGWGENSLGFQFNFDNGLKASEWVDSIIKDIDTVFPVVVSEIDNETIPQVDDVPNT